jgi:large subunit ribosomal protein L9
MTTQLLLIEDVDHLGRSGDIVTVKPGYARNFLLPRSLAVIADKKAVARQARLQEARREKAAKDKADAEAIAVRMVEVALTTEVKVDQDGHMYGSVSAADVVHLLQEQAKIVVEKKSVLLPHPIRKTGTHTISFKLQEGVPAQVILKIFAEGQTAEEQQSPASE